MHVGKELQDSKTLAENPMLKNGSIIFLVLQLHSGQDTGKRVLPRDVPLSDEPCVITGENFKDNGVVVLKMPCGHPTSQDGLMEYALFEVSSNKSTGIKCPSCSTEWPFDVIVKYGGPTSAELEQLEKGISLNSLCKRDDVNVCPRCRSYFSRVDPYVLCVKCLVCSNFYFCWDCLKEWKKPLSSSTCGNGGCGDSGRLTVLRNSETMTYGGVEIFKIRACPSCGTTVEFSGGCKHVQCERCKVEFCCVCLQMRENGSWQCSSYHSTCHPAPLQTVIPRR